MRITDSISSILLLLHTVVDAVVVAAAAAAAVEITANTIICVDRLLLRQWIVGRMV